MLNIHFQNKSPVKKLGLYVIKHVFLHCQTKRKCYDKATAEEVT